MVGVQLLQGGVEMSRGWFPKNEWEGLLLLQVFAGFGELILLHLSIKDQSDSFELLQKPVQQKSDVAVLAFFFLTFCFVFCFSSSLRWLICSREAGVKGLKNSVPTGGSREASLQLFRASRTAPSSCSRFL